MTQPVNMLTAPDYADQIRQILAVTEPDLDTSIGSVTRKIIDAIAQVFATSQADASMVDYLFNLDAKAGADLDDFALMFSITRLAPARATGTATFSRPAGSTEDIPIPSNTQIAATSSTPTVIFATVTNVVLPAGQTAIDIPIQAVVPGASGNLAAHTLTAMATDVGGISAVTNNDPTSGGSDAETDDQMRDRFRRTVFRQLAGTEAMFLGTALDSANPTQTDPNATSAPNVQALVLGASQRWREQVQVQADGTATSTIPAGNVKYIYNGTQMFGPDIDSGGILVPGIHYTFDTTVTPPVIRGLGTALQVGALYDLDFEYSSAASRNDPANGITNRVDVWVTGSNPTEAVETTYLRRSRAFNTLAGNPLNVANFVRDDSGTPPASGNYYVQLAYGPILTFPDSLTVAGTTYYKGTDYWLVHDDTAFGWGPTSNFGIEWSTAHAPVDGAQIVLSGGSGYSFNSVPRDVENRVRQWRLTTTDVRAHAAKIVQLRVNLVVQFDPLAPQSQTIDNITATLTQFFAARGFDAILQVSDILQAAHSVVGVDNVRMMTSYEQGVNVTAATGYAIQQVNAAGAVIKTFATPDPATAGQSARATDIVLGDNQVPVLYDVHISTRAQNTFGST